MSWQVGVFWFTGIATLSVGWAIKYSVARSLILLGILLMFTAYFGEWDNA